MMDALPSATTLVLDFLAAAAGRAMAAQDLCRAGLVMGYSEAAIRVALTRLAQQGKIVKLERAMYALDSGRNRLQRDVETWAGRVTWMRPWDGGWIGVHDGAVDRADRAAWRDHQRALRLRGFETWLPGFHLRPDNLAGGVEGLRVELGELGLARGAGVFEAGAFSPDQRSGILALWDIPALRRGYAERLEQAMEGERRLASLDLMAAARESLLVGRELIGHMLRDPLLPEALIEGTQLQDLAAAVARYQAASQAIWNRALAEEPLDMTG